MPTATLALGARAWNPLLTRFLVVLPPQSLVLLFLAIFCKHRIQIKLIPLVCRISDLLRCTRLRALVIVRGLVILLA